MFQIRSFQEFRTLRECLLSPEKRLIVDDSIRRSQADDKLAKMLEVLPEDQGAVNFMRHYSDMIFKGIAATTNVALIHHLAGSVMALLNLRKLLWEDPKYKSHSRYIVFPEKTVGEHVQNILGNWSIQ